MAALGGEPPRGSPTRAEDTVERQLRAYNRRDLDAFLDCYSPEVVIADGNGNVLMRGRDAMRAAYGELFGDSPALHAEAATRIRVGDYVIDEEVVTGRRGSPDEIRVAAIYHVAGDFIDHVRLIR
jgi:hypothetical protein